MRCSSLFLESFPTQVPGDHANFAGSALRTAMRKSDRVIVQGHQDVNETLSQDRPVLEPLFHGSPLRGRATG